jgi:prepilin-type N-terminal cleavage/methylation domain-containing protein
MKKFKKLIGKEDGFTIIEVVLVLAIAGLIFLVVFLALPQLQRSRRDTQRKNDAGRMLAALESSAGNSSGNYPTSSAELATWSSAYLTSGEYVDPDGGDYSPTWAVPNASTINGATAGTVWIGNSTCGSNGVPSSGNSRDISVTIKLEDGFYCQDNQ